MTAISGPVAYLSNPPINPQYYSPEKNTISAITFGTTTIITTATDNEFVVGQLVRLNIPEPYGAIQLDNLQLLIIAKPADDQVEVAITSTFFTPFIPSPYTATITNATAAYPCVLTANNNFVCRQSIRVTGVQGMTSLNNRNFFISSCTATSITIEVDSSLYLAYTGGGTATLLAPILSPAQIIPIGDFNSGFINNSGSMSTGTYIPGSFINISPL